MIRGIGRVLKTNIHRNRNIPEHIWRNTDNTLACRFSKPFFQRAKFSSLVSGKDPSEGKNEFTDIPGSKLDTEKYVIVYTCNVCDTRSAKKITKSSYHKGCVVILCPKCNHYHLIADHLGIFGEKGWNIEEFIRNKESEGTNNITDTPVTDSQFKFVNNDNVYELSLKDIAGGENEL